MKTCVHRFYLILTNKYISNRKNSNIKIPFVTIYPVIRVGKSEGDWIN